ncbi:MAG: hypothetical protein DRQ54_08395 [Gammaproteobacteria bacterium]|nr:MAG: hypothetical protein DRQ54_08395 [Gammaproteobacteria bacterium]
MTRGSVSTQFSFQMDSTTAVGTFIMLGIGAPTVVASTYHLNGKSFGDIANAGSTTVVDASDVLSVGFGAGGDELLPGNPNILMIEVPLLSGTHRYALFATNYDFDDQSAVTNVGPYVGTIAGLTAACQAAVDDVGNTDDRFDITFVAGHTSSATPGDEGEADVGTPEAADTGLSAANPTDNRHGSDREA